jgi:hypothetical protein
MACDTQPFTKNQTLTERKQQVREAVEALAKLLVSGSVKAVVGPQGAVTFAGWNPNDRKAISDVCAYRQLMARGSALAKQQIAKAEALAGRSVDRKVVAHGHHSHDGGHTWHGGHGHKH